MIAIIDLDLGNLHSVHRAIQYCGGTSVVTDAADTIESAEKIIIPGVGSYKAGMDSIHRKELLALIKSRAAAGIPILGICLGMQLLMDHSEENGSTQGLGLIPGNVLNFKHLPGFKGTAKIPHINWCELKKASEETVWEETVLQGVVEGEECYFVHSFCVVPTDARDSVAVSDYGGCRFTSVIRRNNIVGCQFHPEKSGDVGLKIVRNFVMNEQG